ncbi:MAG: 7-carboxy-7-deazaguanine synthase QueE [Prevotellaceae bacterium]|nr:7-carboxy-7-deazaguanine synthase QueE [Prevotellaceae bacterium]
MYKVNDIFSSLQGEGHHTGRAATFVRFAGCNLKCPFCDTDFTHYREMSAEEIVESVKQYTTRFVVLTGGEPSLQVDDTLVAALHEAGFYIAIETNGTRLLPESIDWVTVSPKQPLTTTSLPQIESGRVNEIKVVFDGTASDILLSIEHLEKEAEYTRDSFHNLPSPLLFLQPCDVGDAQHNAEITRQCIEYIMQHPCWQLSLQTHKLANFK